MPRNAVQATELLLDLNVTHGEPMRTKLLLAGFWMLTGVAIAQGDPSLNGDWVAKFPSLTGRPAQVNVKIDGSVGTWQSTAQSPNNPCLGRKYPLSVAVTDPDRVTLTVNGSQALTGCEDFKLELKRVNATTFESQFQDGRKVLITR
jgi:hypothetical protein